MGTYAVIDMPSEREVYETYRALREIERKISDYMEDSEISQINRSAGIGPVRVSPITYRLLKRALALSELTGGHFDITIGSYTINYKRKGILKEEEARKLVDYRKLVLEKGRAFLLHKGMAIDTGGIGKGFALSEIRRSAGSPRGFASIGGDMVVWGHKRTLAVRTPFEARPFVEGINKADLCLSTSGNYHQRHIEQEDEELVQVTVAYEDCTTADALATALFSMSRKERRDLLKKVPTLGVLEVYRDHSFWMNREFADRFEVLFLKSP